MENKIIELKNNYKFIDNSLSYYELCVIWRMYHIAKLEFYDDSHYLFSDFINDINDNDDCQIMFDFIHEDFDKSSIISFRDYCLELMKIAFNFASDIS